MKGGVQQRQTMDGIARYNRHEGTQGKMLRSHDRPVGVRHHYPNLFLIICQLRALRTLKTSAFDAKCPIKLQILI